MNPYDVMASSIGEIYFKELYTYRGAGGWDPIKKEWKSSSLEVHICQRYPHTKVLQVEDFRN